MEEIYKERARQRQLSKLKDVKDTLPLAQNYAIGKEIEIGKVSEIIAKKVGLSPRTFELEKVESEQARLRQLSALNDVKDKLPIRPIERDGEKGDTREIVSKKAGISRGTYERGKTIIQKASNEIKNKAKSVKFQRILFIDTEDFIIEDNMVKKLKILQQNL